MSNTRHVTITEESNKPTFIPFVSRGQTPFSASWRFLIAEQLNTGVNCKELKEFLLDKEKEVLKIDPNTHNDGGTGLGNKSTTSRFLYYNVLSWKHPQIDKLKREIYRLYYSYFTYCFPDVELSAEDFNGISASCWMNVMRKNERIRLHQHGYHSASFISGHFCVSSNETKTVYVNPYERQEENFLVKEADSIDEDKMIYHPAFNYTVGNPAEKMYVSRNIAGKLTLFPNFVPHFTTKHRTDDVRITLAFELKPRYDNYVPLFNKQLIKYDDTKKTWIKNDDLFT